MTRNAIIGKSELTGHLYILDGNGKGKQDITDQVKRLGYVDAAQHAELVQERDELLLQLKACKCSSGGTIGTGVGEIKRQLCPCVFWARKFGESIAEHHPACDGTGGRRDEHPVVLVGMGDIPKTRDCQSCETLYIEIAALTAQAAGYREALFSLRDKIHEQGLEQYFEAELSGADAIMKAGQTTTQTVADPNHITCIGGNDGYRKLTKAQQTRRIQRRR